MKVLKFGGSSVASSENIEKVLAIIAKESKNEKVAIVVSAFGKTTDKLLAAANEAIVDINIAKNTLETIKNLHFEIIENLITKDMDVVSKEVFNLFKRLNSIYEGIFLLQELSDKNISKSLLVLAKDYLLLLLPMLLKKL